MQGVKREGSGSVTPEFWGLKPGVPSWTELLLQGPSTQKALYLPSTYIFLHPLLQQYPSILTQHL